MTISDKNGSAAAFADIAAKFCAWCEGPIADEHAEMRTAAALLAGLHMVAFLPEPEGEGSGLDDVSADDMRSVRERFDCLPVRGYWYVADPTMTGEGDTKFADLPDDFAGIYGDLKNGLTLFEAGFYDDAIWQWKQQYRSRWGRHLFEAEKCVFSWLERHDVR